MLLCLYGLYSYSVLVWYMRLSQQRVNAVTYMYTSIIELRQSNAVYKMLFMLSSLQNFSVLHTKCKKQARWFGSIVIHTIYRIPRDWRRKILRILGLIDLLLQKFNSRALKFQRGHGPPDGSPFSAVHELRNQYDVCCVCNCVCVCYLFCLYLFAQYCSDTAQHYVCICGVQSMYVSFIH